MMAAALAGQRQASDRAIEERRKAQAELDESTRAMEEMEKVAREIYEGIRRLEKGSGVPSAKEGLEIPDSM
jgi:predicted  nucleic acid-binding Zn-ribbon protein